MNEEKLMDALRVMQGCQIADALMIRAIISSHPNPGGLRARWNELFAQSATDSALAKAGAPEQAAIEQACMSALHAWSSALSEEIGER